MRAVEGVYRCISTYESTSMRCPSRAAAKANLFDIELDYCKIDTTLNKTIAYLPLVKQEPFPAPNEESATDIGIIMAAMPNTCVPHVCQ